MITARMKSIPDSEDTKQETSEADRGTDRPREKDRKHTKKKKQREKKNATATPTAERDRTTATTTTSKERRNKNAQHVNTGEPTKWGGVSERRRGKGGREVREGSLHESLPLRKQKAPPAVKSSWAPPSLSLSLSLSLALPVDLPRRSPGQSA